MTTTELKWVARNNVDLIAVAHVALGFVPQDSLVVTVLGARQFHCRVDLPPSADRDNASETATALVAQLTDVARSHAAESVHVVIFSAETAGMHALAWAVIDSFRRAGIGVIDVVRVADGRWYLPAEGGHAASVGFALDIAAHPLILEAQVKGRGILASREEVAEELIPDREGAARVLDLLGAGVPPARLPPAALRLGRSTSGQIAAWLSGWEDGPPWEWVRAARRARSQQWEWWAALVRSAPEQYAADLAALAALAAWASGDGARSWCAVDRCLERRSDHPLGVLVSRLLLSATPPDAAVADTLLRSVRTH